MATFLPPNQAQQSYQFTSTSPPESYMSNVPQRVDHSNGLRALHPSQIDPRSNALPAYGNGNGTMPVPKRPHTHLLNGGPRHRSSMSFGGPQLDAARSPPNTKNTSHVPCKFYRIGQCQAGNACPFSHSTDVSDIPCKYFAKGNCKFGPKCANAHILPNGMRAGRPNALLGGPLNIGGRVDPQIYHPQDSVLANSLLAQQANSDQSTFNHQFSNLGDVDYAPQTNLPATYYDTSATFDTGYNSPGSKYGSPREDGRLPLSPAGHLSTLDAPMPASFDSQGVSFIARHGPVAASVPSKFGLESPPASLPIKSGVPSNALRSLHDSAFGQDPRFNASNLGSSPLGSGDEGYGRRIMHSQRVGKPKMMSASLPRARANEEWDEGFMFGGEEDFLPTSLHELLVPQERMRRFSRTEQDERSFRDNSSGIDTPIDPASQVGSPSHASPSRFSALFAKQRREEQNNGASSASVFGHVGSPLRNSSLQLSKSPNLRATSNPVRSGDVSPFLSSPPRQSSMSMISQQLARTRISSKGDATHPEAGSMTNGLHPSSARNQNQSSVSSSHLNRVASSGNISNNRIDEEQGEGVFSMEEEDENHRKRHSVGTWSYQQNPALDHRKRRPTSPQLGPIGTGRTPRMSGAENVSKEYWA